MTGPKNEVAVSVIIGTLLLILITVTAAAGLALMVSQMQKDEMNRQTHLNAVKNEQIQIQHISLSNDRAAWNQSPLNIPAEQSWDNWSSINLILTNLNTDDARVLGVAVNDRYSRNITVIDDTPSALRHSYNISSGEYLNLPGSTSRKIQINFTDDFPSTQYNPGGNQIQVRVITSLYNTFEMTFKPPNPVFSTKIETEDLGTVQRNVLVLDGSPSTADNMVADWNWTISSAAHTFPQPGNWTDVPNQSISYSQGKTARVTPATSGPFRISLKVTDDVGMTRTSGPVDIPAGQFNPPANLQLLPPSPAIIEPIGTSDCLNDICVYNTTLTAKLSDINNNPVSGAIITIFTDNNPNTPQNCFYIPGMSNTTDINGISTFYVSQRKSNTTTPYTYCPQPVTLHAQYGKLISPTILIPGTPT